MIEKEFIEPTPMHKFSRNEAAIEVSLNLKYHIIN